MGSINMRLTKDLEKADMEEVEEYIENNEHNDEWEAIWSGAYPNLCSGEWTLYRNGKKVSVPIPFEEESAYTYGTHYYWYFGEEWSEEFEPYNSGLDETEWIEENKDYLREVTEDESQWPKIYEAFQENDFRMGECGGCI